LRDTLAELGVEGVTAYQNVVRCHPPKNKLPAHAPGLCKVFLEQDIARLQPTLILLFGRTAIRAVLGVARQANWWGAMWERDNALVLSTWHPAYILRKPDLKEVWVNDIREAIKDMKEKYDQT